MRALRLDQDRRRTTPARHSRSTNLVHATLAGYEWVTSHVFRKTAATVLDHAGLSARAIAGHIGHARPSITQDVYMDKRAAGREAADAFDAALGPTTIAPPLAE